MYRLLCVAGLGMVLAFVAAPAAAQSVNLDVGVRAGQVGGRVVFGAPSVYDRHRPYRYDDHHRKHDKRWRKAQSKYHKRLRKLERERAKAEREYEREYRKWWREVDRYGRH